VIQVNLNHKESQRTQIYNLYFRDTDREERRKTPLFMNHTHSHAAADVYIPFFLPLSSPLEEPSLPSLFEKDVKKHIYTKPSTQREQKIPNIHIHSYIINPVVVAAAAVSGNKNIGDVDTHNNI
jgi:hypothetical protein